MTQIWSLPEHVFGRLVKFQLELQSEADLSLSVAVLLTLVIYRAVSTVAKVRVRTIESRSVEQVEVIDLQNPLEALAKVEMLSDVGALVVIRRLP